MQPTCIVFLVCFVHRFCENVRLCFHSLFFVVDRQQTKLFYANCVVGRIINTYTSSIHIQISIQIQIKMPVQKNSNAHCANEL